jgi:hypothetical protein
MFPGGGPVQLAQVSASFWTRWPSWSRSGGVGSVVIWSSESRSRRVKNRFAIRDQLMSCRTDRATPGTASAPAQAIKVTAPAPGDTR